MISWGIVAGATAFCTGATSLLIMRFLLGAAEAGFFPGVILYLTYWFPAAYRARMVGFFMVSIPAANGLGSPIAGYLLSVDGLLGLHGWQWLFVLEAVPTVLLGFVAYVWLTDRPSSAAWLSHVQREWLVGELARDAAARDAARGNRAGDDALADAGRPARAVPRSRQRQHHDGQHRAGDLAAGHHAILRTELRREWFRQCRALCGGLPRHGAVGGGGRTARASDSGTTRCR